MGKTLDDDWKMDDGESIRVRKFDNYLNNQIVIAFLVRSRMLEWLEHIFSRDKTSLVRT